MVSSFAIRTSRVRPGLYSSGSNPATSYRSPRFGYAVECSDPWTMPDADGRNTSIADPFTDQILLKAPEFGHAEVSVVGASRCNLLDACDMVRFWMSEAYVSEFMSPGTVVVLADHARTSGGVLMVSPGMDGAAPVGVLKETYELGDTTAIRVTFTADLAQFCDIYQGVQQALRINQRGLLRFFSSDLLLTVLS